jgi:hypothetical protein
MLPWGFSSGHDFGIYRQNEPMTGPNRAVGRNENEKAKGPSSDSVLSPKPLVCQWQSVFGLFKKRVCKARGQFPRRA